MTPKIGQVDTKISCARSLGSRARISGGENFNPKMKFKLGIWIANVQERSILAIGHLLTPNSLEDLFQNMMPGTHY